MLLKNYISSKEGFSFVIKKCVQYAPLYRLNVNDVQSESFFRIAIAIKNSPETDIELPRTYITRLIVNVCLKMIKDNKKLSFEYIDDEAKEIELMATPTHDLFEMDCISKIDQVIRNKYSDSPEQIKIYEDLVLGDENGLRLAEQLNMTHGSVRVRATRLREFAKKIYAAIL